MSDVIADKVVKVRSEVQAEKLKALMEASKVFNRNQEVSLKQQINYANELAKAYSNITKAMPKKTPSIPKASVPKASPTPKVSATKAVSNKPKVQKKVKPAPYIKKPRFIPSYSASVSARTFEEHFKQEAKAQADAKKKAKEQAKFNALQKKQLENIEKVDYKTHRYLDTLRKINAKEASIADKELKNLNYANRSLEGKKRALAEVKEEIRQIRRRNKELAKGNYFSRRAKSSVMQKVGGVASVYGSGAVLGGATRMGQNYDSMQSAMLSVSDDSKQAGENVKFVREQAIRLGLDINNTGKSFAKMLGASGDMSLDQVKEGFLGIAENATVLGLSADSTNRAMTALQQMMSKGTVSAEELKQQMGDVMPNALKIMQKAAYKTGVIARDSYQDLQKAMKDGLLTTNKVLPMFNALMREAASKNGALEKQLDSNVVAMKRLGASADIAFLDFYNGKYEKSTTSLFKRMSDLLNNNTGSWKALGSIVGSIVGAITGGINLINKALDPLSSIFYGLTQILGDFSGILAVLPLAFVAKKMLSLMEAVGKTSKAFATLNTILTGLGFTKVLGGLTKLGSGMMFLIGKVPVLGWVLRGLATAWASVAAGESSALWPLTLIALAIAGIVVIAEDLMETFFPSGTGKKTFFGPLLKKFKEWWKNFSFKDTVAHMTEAFFSGIDKIVNYLGDQLMKIPVIKALFGDSDPHVSQVDNDKDTSIGGRSFVDYKNKLRLERDAKLAKKWDEDIHVGSVKGSDVPVTYVNNPDADIYKNAERRQDKNNGLWKLYNKDTGELLGAIDPNKQRNPYRGILNKGNTKATVPATPPPKPSFVQGVLQGIFTREVKGAIKDNPPLAQNLSKDSSTPIVLTANVNLDGETVAQSVFNTTVADAYTGQALENANV